jgi:Rrf2 family protein
MPKLFSLSEAASIAIHSMILIAKNEGRSNVVYIAETMGFSKHHVAKVLQKLVKAELLKSNRGPAGGFSVNKPINEINLLQIYEIIEGKIVDHECFMEYHNCPFKACLLENVVSQMNHVLIDYMSNKTIEFYISNGY